MAHDNDHGATAKKPDPASTDETSANARDGARKRREPSAPAAVIGIGASAGGIAPLQQFFTDMKPDTGLAFVVVMHLSPEFESQLANVIQQKTTMPVMQVNGPVPVKANHVYVIPPNHQLTFNDSTLDIVPPQQVLGRRITIDLFFRTLAQAYGQRAVCVIMSGTDSDGVIGLKHIRAQGGLTIVQDPNEAQFDSMPASAISTGMVDWVLPVAEMPDKLLEFVTNENRMVLPPEIPESEDPEAKEGEAPGGETVANITRSAEDEEAIGKVLADVRAQTGHDFSHYKRATILRRIARRMQVNSIESIPRYLDFIRTHSAEGRALLQDLLIGVTHFFRDRESFASLEAHIPQLFAGKKAEDEVRVWVVGCATGEEAYSLAMLLSEHCKRLENPPKVQIFATDIDEEAVADARDGLYPSMIEADVSPERLREFFQKDHGRYRVRKEIREKVLFAAHNILKDAPFSRCDLISCRNLLIYLRPEAQSVVFDVFHFALRSGGLLFLGGTENHGLAQSLFSPLDGKHRVFVRRSTPRPIWKIPTLPMRQPSIGSRRPPGMWRNRALPPLTQDIADHVAEAGAAAVHAGHARREVLFGELHLRLLEQYGPPSVVVNELHEIVHLSQSAGRYLRFVAGEPTANITKVVNPGLAIELRTALFKAAQTKASATGSLTPIDIHGETEVITLEVRPMSSGDQAEGFFLVLFNKQEVEGEGPAPQVPTHDAIARGADEEIQYLKEQLANTVEQYEASNEELKASNEELQAMNEEMRSATEELETSKEELQSVNEELTTVNYELRANVEELSKTNADLNNLMASTDIGTVFLDRQLRIHRFTPSAQKIFNLIPADIGRPISDITSRLHYDGFIAECEQVLQDLHTTEREVRVGDEEQWYLTRIAPYRTGEDRIAGVVATFINITARRRVEEELRESHQRTHEILESVNDAFYAVDGDFRFTYVNKKAEELWQRKREMLIGKNFWTEFPQAVGSLSYDMHYRALQEGRALQYETQSPIVGRWVDVSIYPGKGGGLSVYFRDISARKTAEESLRASEERFRQFAENSADTLWMINAETRQLEYLSPAYDRMWGEPREAVMQNLERWVELLHPEDRDGVLASVERVLAGETLSRDYRIVRPSDGKVHWIRDVGFAIRDRSDRIVRIAGIAQDITADKEHADQLVEAEERFRLLVEGARDYAMFLLDPENRITYWSRGAERVFGWTRDEAVGQSGNLIFTPEDKEKGAVEHEIGTALREGAAPDRRWHLRKDGRRIWVDGIMRRLDHDTGTLRGFAKIARDASEQKDAEDALCHARDEMEQRVVERTADLVATNNKLNRTMAERAQLERELLTISEREKRRIGEDLHDGVCQELTATAFFLKSSAKKIETESPYAAAMLHESADTVNRNVGITRDLARGLQPADLKGAGLKEALRALAAQAGENTNIKCEFKAARGVRVPDDNVAVHLYRVAQEAVKNAVKHSGATHILISLDRDKDKICVSVSDNGKGFSPKRRTKGLGLHIMRYRANALGGELKIERRRTGGMEITCVIPVKK